LISSQIPAATANGKTPSEVFIFFPYTQFMVIGGLTSPIACYFGSPYAQVACNSVEENWLRISIPSSATLNSGQLVTVAGIAIRN
jgi:hypothetical protein